MRDPIIGIDLGTSNSVVAVAGEDGARVLADPGGRKIQPTVVSFHPSGSVIVGAAAKQRRIIDPVNTVYSAKRLIGRAYGSREVNEAAARVPYTIKQGVNRQPVVVTRAGEFAIPELAAIALDHLRGLAQAALSTEITRAVVAVPANFTDAQRTATITAGDIAGIEVVQVINEPTAAALACGHHRQLDRRVAVYDFGGGTFDITILDVRGPIFEVLSTAGDPFLGGDDMDERLVETMVALFFEKEGIDLRGNEQAMQRLRTVAEQVKVELSRRDRARITIDALTRGAEGAALDFSMRVTRADLEAHANELVDRSFSICLEALRMAGLSASDIQEVVLVGGTTKMPLVRARVSEFFGRTPRTDTHPDEAVALGAAIHGNTLRQTMGQSPRQARRRHTAPGMVAPPAPPMEARAPVSSGQEGPWERGSTMPWMGFGEGPGVPGLARPGTLESLDLVSEPPGLEEEQTDVATHVATQVARAGTRAARGGDDEVGTDVETQVARDSARSLRDDDEVGTDVETQVARDSARSLGELVVAPPGQATIDQLIPIIIEVAPLSLSVATVAGYCRQLVPRNSRVPAETREVFTTSRDLQRTVRIRVCQGESRRFDENQALGDLVLDGIEPRPRGETRIEVVFRIDESGILHVRARDLNTGLEQRAELVIAGAPSEEEVTAASQRLRRLRG